MNECCCKKKLNPRSEDEKKKLVSRINRIIGQLNGIKNMIEEDRYCEDVLIQLSASDKAIKGLASVIFNEHLHSCILENMKNGNYESVDEISELFKRFF
jgi:DNA-binding FrmR family transcriptional regulator